MMIGGFKSRINIDRQCRTDMIIGLKSRTDMIGGFTINSYIIIDNLINRANMVMSRLKGR